MCTLTQKWHHLRRWWELVCDHDLKEHHGEQYRSGKGNLLSSFRTEAEGQDAHTHQQDAWEHQVDHVEQWPPIKYKMVYYLRR